MTGHSLAPILRFVLAERGWPCPERLERLAGLLPAVATAGLELPLVADGAIDLQQRIRHPAEIARLGRWLARSAPSNDAWRRLAGALAAIADDDLVDEYWLELDEPADERADDPPLSVFTRIREASEAAAAPAIAHILEAFGMRLSAARREALDRCVAACGPGGRVSHLGLMLGRPGAPLRLIMEGVQPDDTGGLLRRAGWPGPLDAAEAWIDRLFVHADRIRLALTLADTLLPDIGLECFVGDPTANDPRWRCLFDMLVRDGLCTPARRDQLLAWPGALTPVSTTEWPEGLIVDALLRTEQAVHWLDCRISHTKVTLAAGGVPTAKGYFGFVEVQDESDDVPDPPSRPVGHQAGAAIDAAVAFLLGARNQAGWWLDYDGFSEGPAEEWVTAYVAHALHMSAGANANAHDAVVRAWRLLEKRARCGWGWNFLQPLDADSMVWSLRLAGDLGMEKAPKALEAIACLGRHVQADGGIATYHRDFYADWSNGKEVNAAWYEAHACVTAAAAHLPGLGPAPLEYLRLVQRADGFWRGYWWRSDLYTTTLAAEALAATGNADDAGRVARAVEATLAWLDRDIGGDGPRDPSFEMALALRTLLLSPAGPWDRVAQLADRLRGAQLADGSWRASAALSIPNKQGELVPAIDNRRCLTTATVLEALRRFHVAEGAHPLRGQA